MKNGMSSRLTKTFFSLLIEPMIYEITINNKNLSSSALKIWELISQSLKDETELSQFKTNINKWITGQCP